MRETMATTGNALQWPTTHISLILFSGWEMPKAKCYTFLVIKYTVKTD